MPTMKPTENIQKPFLQYLKKKIESHVSENISLKCGHTFAYYCGNLFL